MIIWWKHSKNEFIVLHLMDVSITNISIERLVAKQAPTNKV